MPRLVTSLWFDTQALGAAEHYCSIFPRSEVTRVARYGEAGPGEPGTVLTVDFTLDGAPFTAINGGPLFTFSEAISIVIDCADQDEVDRYWAALTDGGEEGRCGWCKDRYGLSWQVVPRRARRPARRPRPRPGPPGHRGHAGHGQARPRRHPGRRRGGRAAVTPAEHPGPPRRPPAEVPVTPTVATADAPAPPALGDVDELCRLVLVAGRLGCRVHLEGASDELRGALVLAGVDELLVDGLARENRSDDATGPARAIVVPGVDDAPAVDAGPSVTARRHREGEGLR